MAIVADNRAVISDTRTRPTRRHPRVYTVTMFDCDDTVMDALKDWALNSRNDRVHLILTDKLVILEYVACGADANDIADAPISDGHRLGGTPRRLCECRELGEHCQVEDRDVLVQNVINEWRTS